MREAYRLNQGALVAALADRSEVLTLMVVFRGKPVAAGACIPKDIPRVLERLEAKLRAGQHPPPTGSDALA